MKKILDLIEKYITRATVVNLTINNNPPPEAVGGEFYDEDEFDFDEDDFINEGEICPKCNNTDDDCTECGGEFDGCVGCELVSYIKSLEYNINNHKELPQQSKDIFNKISNLLKAELGIE